MMPKYHYFVVINFQTPPGRERLGSTVIETERRLESFSAREEFSELEHEISSKRQFVDNPKIVNWKRLDDSVFQIQGGDGGQ